MARLALTELSAQLDARDGLTRLSPLSAKVYGGQYSGNISIDTRAAVPVLSLDERLAGIDAAALLKDFADSIGSQARAPSRPSSRGPQQRCPRAQRGWHAHGRCCGRRHRGAFDLWNAIAQAQSCSLSASWRQQQQHGPLGVRHLPRFG